MDPRVSSTIAHHGTPYPDRRRLRRRKITSGPDVADRFRTLDATVFSHDAYYYDVSHMAAEELARHIVVVEGILALSSEDLVARASLTLFVDTDADIRLARRLRRDVQHRGIPVKHVLDQYLDIVKPMHDAFVEPSRRRADLIVRGDRSAERTLKMLDGFVLRTMLDDTLEERR